jgi:hypothetical protein
VTTSTLLKCKCCEHEALHLATHHWTEEDGSKRTQEEKVLRS